MENTIKFGNEIIRVDETLPEIGSRAKNFFLTKLDFDTIELKDFVGSRLILNIFPSVDTPVCATALREFNMLAAKMENAKVLCISKDLPFALANFCAANGIDNVISLSDYRMDSGFAREYGVLMIDPPLKYLMARAVIILDENHKVIYTELCKDLDKEPNYEGALYALDSVHA
ncbi:MAG: thiol peroxidase [Opitutales bacterium]